MTTAERIGDAGPSLTIESLRLSYPSRGGAVTVLDIPALTLEGAASLAVTGPSGSGKSSLVHLVTGIERPSVGRVLWGGRAVSGEPESARDRWRRETVGLLFQNFHLVQTLSALQNVLLPQRFGSWRVGPALRAKATESLESVGIADHGRRAGDFSRGEQQRIALVRALLHQPRVLVADEPTASLDTANARDIVDLLLARAAALRATLIVVSHDEALLARFPTVLRLEAGRPVYG